VLLKEGWNPKQFSINIGIPYLIFCRYKGHHKNPNRFRKEDEKKDDEKKDGEKKEGEEEEEDKGPTPEEKAEFAKEIKEE